MARIFWSFPGIEHHTSLNRRHVSIYCETLLFWPAWDEHFVPNNTEQGLSSSNSWVSVLHMIFLYPELQKKLPTTFHEEVHPERWVEGQGNHSVARGWRCAACMSFILGVSRGWELVRALKKKPPETSLVSFNGRLGNRLGQNPRASWVKLAKGNGGCWKRAGWLPSSVSSPSRAAYQANFPRVFGINGPETYGFYFPRNSDVFHNEVENCSENTHQRLPQVLKPSKHILYYFADFKN